MRRRHSIRWVLSCKIKNGENVTKARLCAQAFKEIKDFPTDSPWCSQTGVQSIFVLIASNKWKVQAIDVKTAFPQGKQIERTVYLQLLKEANKEANTNKIWKLQKCLYGLADTSRYWYLREKEELIKLGANVSSVDSALFYWKEHYQPVGILACHVDDMIWGGNENFKINVINNLKNIFTFGSEETKAFTYLGIQLIQNDDFSSTKTIRLIAFLKSNDQKIERKNSLLSNEEKTSYRSAVGHLNRVAEISRPDISFSVCEGSTKFKQATVADVLYVNKIIKNVKNSENAINFSQLNRNNIKLQLFTDASFSNLPNGGSQAGQTIFITDDKSKTCPLHWNSSKIKREVGDSHFEVVVM